MELIPRRTKKNTCPECGALLDAVTCLTEVGARPAPGDVTVCIECKNRLDL
jgi:hypothetical protein